MVLLAAAKSPPPWALIAVAASGAIAVVLIVARWNWWGPDPDSRPLLGQMIGPASWSFGESWGSNLTAFGALLGGILLSGVVPEPARYVAVRDLVLLNLLFGFLVVLAPFVYTATGSRVIQPAAPPDDAPVVAYEGRVVTLLLSSAVTLWAALGVAMTIGLAAADLAPKGGLFYVVVGVVAVVAGLMVTYSWRSIRWILEAQAEHETRAGLMAGGPPAPRPRWTLL